MFEFSPTLAASSGTTRGYLQNYNIVYYQTAEGGSIPMQPPLDNALVHTRRLTARMKIETG